MKIDLTTLPRPQQVAHVVKFLTQACEAGRTADQLLDVELIGRTFKHRGAGAGRDRQRYFAALLGEAVAVIMAAGAINQADTADAQRAADSTPLPASP